ncbi:hypothetical protein [Actinomyces dentalis]|uniref:hypothetical protein n=1 Tax=Actinomyces dentalis TaxID=272548 RepID=UPI00042821A6|nr:hypothetical protein [Actinomyces dentalis]
MSSSTSSPPDAPTGVGASAAGTGPASSAERFRPGGMSEEEARRYAGAVGMDEGEDGDGDEDEDEDPGRRSDRLRRRRRMLLVGGPPAVIVVLLAAWLAFLSLMTMAANNAVIHKDYRTAVSRYAIVARVDPWLEKWRVHYNLGTAQLLDGRLDQAQASLETALKTAPKANMVKVTREDGTTDQIRDPGAPECLVRTNLYAVHVAAWYNAVSTGNTAEAQARRAAMTEAAGECEVVPPPEEPDPTPSPSPPPSPEPSPSPTPTASSDPSPTPPPTPTPGPSSSPTPGPSPTPAPSPTPTSGPSSSPTPGSSSSPVPSPSPSSSDPKRDKLRERNEDANPTRGPGGSGGRPW